jgi:hypothetical protein
MALAILYSDAMIFFRRTATPKQHPFGEPVWQLTTMIDKPACMPLSALGVILHKWGNDAAAVTKKPDNESVFAVLNTAFETRVSGALYFNVEVLATIGLHEKIWTPFSLAATQTDLVKFTDILQALLTQIKNQKIKNTAFVLKLLPEKMGKDVSFHTITITCDGLWDTSKGFGMQETVYSDVTSGFPSRYGRSFPSIAALAAGLHGFIGTALEYPVGNLQALTVESLPPKSSLRKLLRVFWKAGFLSD